MDSEMEFIIWQSPEGEETIIKLVGIVYKMLC